MSRVLCIPDSHLKIEVIENGLELADKLMCDTVVLLGDYVDEWDSTDDDYRDMILYLKTLLRKRPGVVPLLGNHELSYLGFKCSGYNDSVAEEVRAAFENDMRFLFAVAIDGVLYSHAGITQSWTMNNKVITMNDIRNHMGRKNGAEMSEKAINGVPSLNVLAQVGRGRGGHSAPSPLWADLEELEMDALGKFTQVVGHTPVSQIEKLGNCWFTDVFSNGNISDEYLYIVDGEPEIVHYNELILGEF